MGQAIHRGEYPSDWPQLAALVKAEAGNKCVRCDHAHHYESGHVLTVHHFDGDKSNGARWNLMALCQRCHLSVQARVDPEVGLMFDPSLWAMPYIAGYYLDGRGTPGPCFDLERWIAEYTASHRTWPAWAPVVIQIAEVV